MQMGAGDSAIVSVNVVTTLASALEQLGARIDRDLNPESSEGALPDDPAWASTIIDVVSFAKTCLAALNEPHVVEALTLAYRSR
jgi:hypothetical protein